PYFCYTRKVNNHLPSAEEQISLLISHPTTQIVLENCLTLFNTLKMLSVENAKENYENLMQIKSFNKIAQNLENMIKGEKFNKEMILETLSTAAYALVTEVWEISYKITGDHLTAVVPFPVTIFTDVWNMVTILFPKFVNDFIASATAAVETIRYQIPKVANAIAERVPFIVKYIKTEVPILVKEVLPEFINFAELIMASAPVKLLKAKINELIAMYPAQFKAMENFVNLCTTTFNGVCCICL
ncbi:unnamed protein product, partial [Meganyctiphanes norvegica]